MRGLLTTPLRGGAHDLSDRQGVADLLSSVGWRVVEVDLGDARRTVAEIGGPLGFPDWYGGNLDALHDCLGGLDRPTALLVRPADARDPYAEALLEVLTDRAVRVGGVPVALVRCDSIRP